MKSEKKRNIEGIECLQINMQHVDETINNAEEGNPYCSHEGLSKDKGLDRTIRTTSYPIPLK